MHFQVVLYKLAENNKHLVLPVSLILSSSCNNFALQEKKKSISCALNKECAKAEKWRLKNEGT